jgi:hypothetical protein
MTVLTHDAPSSGSTASWQKNKWPFRQTSEFVHCMFALGGCVIVAIAIVCGILFTVYYILLLLIIVPFFGFWYALKEKDDIIRTMEDSISRIEMGKRDREYKISIENEHASEVELIDGGDNISTEVVSLTAVSCIGEIVANSANVSSC